MKFFCNITKLVFVIFQTLPRNIPKNVFCNITRFVFLIFPTLPCDISKKFFCNITVNFIILPNPFCKIPIKFFGEFSKLVIVKFQSYIVIFRIFFVISQGRNTRLTYYITCYLTCDVCLT